MPKDPSLVLQKVIRERLTASAELIALVPADKVMDVSGRPERSPLIQIGEGHTLFRQFSATTYATIHIWVQEAGLVTSKQIAGAIIDALSVDPQADGPLHLDGFTCHELSVDQTRFLRDPHGPYSHGVVTIAAIMQEAN